MRGKEKGPKIGMKNLMFKQLCIAIAMFINGEKDLSQNNILSKTYRGMHYRFTSLSH